MRAISLFLCISLFTASVDAVTYQKLDGSVVTLQYRTDPPMFGGRHGVGDHPYSGDNLEPGAAIINNFFGPPSNFHLTLFDADLRNADLRNVTGAFVELWRADLTGANLSNASLPYAAGNYMSFVNANLSGADLSNAHICEYSDFTNAILTNANLSNAELTQNTMTGADFTNANLSGARLPTTMSNAQMLSAASLHGAKFTVGDWTNHDFSNLDLIETDFVGTNLYGANFSGAILRDADLGWGLIGNTQADAINSDFSGADLDGVKIQYRDFTGANFQNAHLTNITETSMAKFVNVDFRNADLSNSFFAYRDSGGSFTHFSQSWGADLSGANLTNATIALDPVQGWSLNDFSGANISGLTFRGPTFDSFDYGNTWTDAFYYTDNEPTWGSGMDQAWRSSVGILALAPVPEPSALLLALFGLALLPRRRRR